MRTSQSSSVEQARTALGARLRDLRRDAGLTGRVLAARCGWHPSKVSRIENAKTPPSAEDIRVWATQCGATEQTTDLIASLRAVEGMFVEWRRIEQSGLRQAQEGRLPLYERTKGFQSYSSWLVPGLIQTRAYTWAALTAIRQQRGLPDDVEEAITARMQRQRILNEADRRFAFLIEESVLRSGIGGTEVMAGQLGHLITVSSLPNVSLGIVPMRPDRTRWPVEGFWIFDTEQVNSELVSGYLTITQPREVELYAQTFVHLAAQAAYGPAARTLITSAIDDLARMSARQKP
jgi:transcriptional regulator with XRE-family HTH domain